MKILLYATFACIAILSLNTKAADPMEYPEVEELSQEAEHQPKFSWFWERKPSSKEKARAKPSQGSAPVAREISSPHIALLLPLTGQYSVAAQAIRDGFISGFYVNERSNPYGSTEVRIYDTVGDNEIVKAYSNAINEGANVVIGPMTKAGLRTLLESRRVDNNTVVIALNTAEGVTRLPRYLYPFSLNPKDEAYRVAQQAWHEGRTHGVILAQDDSYGRRATTAFKRRFEQLGGRISDVVYFDPNRGLEDPVRYVLKVYESKDAQGETRVSRRQDIDFLFLSAKPQQGRQIPPLMQFYYAQGIPIYAMGSVYSGVPNPSLDNDLNGVVFCDSPWIIRPNSRNGNLNNMAKQLLTQPAAQERLFAFGADAFKVAKDITRLSANPAFKLNGATGALSMDKNGFIVREPECARFSLGAPRAL